MAKPRFKQISDQQAAYLQLLIADLNPDNRKLALETISKLYRSGSRFKSPERILPLIVFLCNDEHEKVRRWAFNALALVGTHREVPGIVAALTREVANPDILAAVVVALSALATEDETRAALTQSNLPLEGFALLAAAQQSPFFSAELAKTRIDIDSASVSELRLATLLLGLRKAPEHMFSGRHPNSDVIGELNLHPDGLVSQYSVWAAYEDPRMTLSNLRIKAKDIRDYHSGIRKYGFRLMTEDSATARANREYIEEGTRDPSREAREGLATGFRSTYFNGADEITLPWFRDEETATVRDRLLEHMATCSERCEKYIKPVSVTYEGLNSGGLGRARLEAAAAGTTLYARLKTIEYRAGKYDMFDEKQPSIPISQGLDASKARILIVTALPKESAAVLATFDEQRTFGVENDSAIYYVGQYSSENRESRLVITVNAGMGKGKASVSCANALRSFPNIQHIIMVGIAGGCPNPTDLDTHVRLGDLVVSADEAGVLEYDFIKKTDNVELRRSPRPTSTWFNSAMTTMITQAIAGVRPWEPLIDKLVTNLGPAYVRPEAAKDILYQSGVVVDHPADPGRQPGKPKIFQGLIASADILQKNAGDRDKLRDDFKARAIEMEASGLETAAWKQGKQIYVVRGICDYCDQYKNDDWQNYAAAAAAALARVLIETLPAAWLQLKIAD